MPGCDSLGGAAVERTRFQRFARTIRGMNAKLAFIGQVTIPVMMVVIAADVISRSLFKLGFASHEVSALLMGMLLFFGLAYITAEGVHVAVDLVAVRLPTRVRIVLEVINKSLMAVIMGLMAWQSMELAVEYYNAGETTAGLHIPLFPFLLLLVLAGVTTCVELVISILESVGQIKKGG